MPWRRPHHDAVEQALWVSWLTVAWSAAIGVASAVVGVLVGSLSLVGLGFSVLLDMSSSLVLVWRFRHERRGQAADRHEVLAHRVASIALSVFGVVLAVQALRNLASGARPDASLGAAGLAAVGVVFMPVLARWKYAAATAVGSGALRMDAHITLVGAVMSGVTLVGLLATAAFDWTAADSLAALVLGVVAFRQGVSGLRHWSAPT